MKQVSFLLSSFMFFSIHCCAFERESIQMEGVTSGHVGNSLVSMTAGGFPHSGGSLHGGLTCQRNSWDDLIYFRSTPRGPTTPNPDHYSQERFLAMRRQSPSNALLQPEHKDVRVLAIYLHTQRKTRVPWEYTQLTTQCQTQKILREIWCINKGFL